MTNTHQAEGEGELRELKEHFEWRVFEYHTDLHEALYLKPTGMKLRQEINALFKELEAHIVTCLQAQLDALEAAGPKDKQTYSDWDSQSFMEGHNEANSQWHTAIANKREELGT